MANKPITTTTNTPSPNPVPEDKRYPRPLWIHRLRWVFLHWWLIPLICLISYILDVGFNLYRGTGISNGLLLPFLVANWLLVTLAVVEAIVLLFWAYKWANADETRQYRMLYEQQRKERKQRQRELEQQPPLPGFKLQHTL